MYSLTVPGLALLGAVLGEKTEEMKA
jgi:hypothetical protein